MSLHETPLLERYWEKVGGVLIKEFPVVRRSATCGPRYIDGIIIRCDKRRPATADQVTLRGKHVTVVQVKRGRLRMTLMGQAFFSMALLLHRFRPASVKAVALCEQDDLVLRRLFQRHRGCRVVTLSDLRAM